MPPLRLWAMIAIGAILTITGDVYLKRSNGLGRPADLGIGLAFYTLGCIPVVLAFKKADFGLVFIVWEAVTVVIAILVGRSVFGEAVTPNRMIAVALAVAALVISSR